jgi:hypothetical protein
MVYPIETKSSVKRVLKKKEETNPPKLYLNIIDITNKNINVSLFFFIVMPMSHIYARTSMKFALMKFAFPCKK